LAIESSRRSSCFAEGFRGPMFELLLFHPGEQGKSLCPGNGLSPYLPEFFPAGNSHRG